MSSPKRNLDLYKIHLTLPTIGPLNDVFLAQILGCLNTNTQRMFKPAQKPLR